jgi:hypothetical protein
MSGSFYKKAGGSDDDDPSTKVATPTASPMAGTVASGATVTLSCATDGAVIHYTINDDTPSASSTTYSNPIPITATTTIKAIAVKDGMTNSDILTVVYTIQGPTIEEPKAGAALTSLDAVTAYLAGASGGMTIGDPIPLAVALRIPGDWAKLLSAIATGDRYVDLDLSECTRALPQRAFLTPAAVIISPQP